MPLEVNQTSTRLQGLTKSDESSDYSTLNHDTIIEIKHNFTRHQLTHVIANFDIQNSIENFIYYYYPN